MDLKDFSFIHRYFTAEKQESLLFLLLGIVAILLAVVFFFFIKTNPSFFKGAAIPLLAIGLIQITVGYTVYARSDKQRLDIAYQAGTDPHYISRTEMPRMENVMKNFVIYRYSEIILALAGMALFFIFYNNAGMSFWKGLGCTLAIQALLMLGADHFAEKRGKTYTLGLENFLKT